MKRFKMIFVAAALTLLTIGVFAGKVKFATNGLYANVSGVMKQLDNCTSLTFLSTSGTTQAQIKASGGGTYNLFTHDGSNHVAVYTVTF